MNLDASNLNQAQLDAMKDTEGAVLVLAGAGSGKTRVLTYRVAHLVMDKGVSPYNILAITFTNKATNEMKERLNRLLGEQNKVWISTFHSLCYTIVRENAQKLGFSANFTIYDESDSGRVLKKAIASLGFEESNVKAGINEHISTAKNKGLDPESYYDYIKGLVTNDNQIYQIYKRYSELLKASNAMDFDDLLLNTKLLLDNNKDVADKYANRFKYVHVDEFQDTNAVQFELVKALCSKWGNVFAVGDDDQSIYGWRGAEIGNILNFDKHFRDVKIHKLLQNYRSTSSILDTANNVIKNNAMRHEKALFTDRGLGAKVEYFTAKNDYQETDYVIDSIVALKRNFGYTNKDFAILIRAGHLSRLFESKLQTTRMKYRLMGGFRFFERREVLDVIAYMRIINNMRDTEAIERVINVPKRGIGETTIEKLSEYARNNGKDLIEVILNIDKLDFLKAGAVKNIEQFRGIIADLFQNKSLPLDKFCEYLVERVGFEKYYLSTEKEEDIGRWKNIEEFIRYVKEYMYDKVEPSLEEFLNTVALASDVEQGEIDYDVVTIATMHSVKGLEFKIVYIVGCEEEIFPSAQCIKKGDVEEERRLMYVAITRAMDRLFITCTEKRFLYNRPVDSKPSRFIAEARGCQMADILAESQTKSYLNSKPFIKNYAEYYGNKNKDYSSTAKKEGFSPNKTKPFEKDTKGFVTGADVRHPVYGEGKIVVVIGTGAEATATVLFKQLGVKKFKISVSPLTLIV